MLLRARPLTLFTYTFIPTIFFFAFQKFIINIFHLFSISLRPPPSPPPPLNVYPRHHSQRRCSICSFMSFAYSIMNAPTELSATYILEIALADKMTRRNVHALSVLGVCFWPGRVHEVEAEKNSQFITVCAARTFKTENICIENHFSKRITSRPTSKEKGDNLIAPTK